MADQFTPPPGFVPLTSTPSSSASSNSFSSPSSFAPPPGFVPVSPTSSSPSTPTSSSSFAPPSDSTSSFAPPAGFVPVSNTTTDDGSSYTSRLSKRFSDVWNNSSSNLATKVWDTINTPVIDSSDLQRLIYPNAGGFVRGMFSLASGLTSPLSVALTVGSFGTAGLVESGGAAALKAAGMDAAKIADVVKGSEYVSKAIQNGHNYARGIVDAADAGVNEETLTKGLNILKDAGMPLDSVSANGIVRRMVARGLRASNVATKTAETAGRTAELAVGAGFSAQALIGAAQTYPKVLDALKEGDKDKAIEYATEAIGGGALGFLGGKHAITEAGSLIPEAEAALGLRVKPTEENQKLRAEFGQRDAEARTASQRAMIWVERQRKDFGDLKPEDLRRVLNFVEAGADKDVMRQRYRDLAAAANLTPAIPDPRNVYYHGTDVSRALQILNAGEISPATADVAPAPLEGVFGITTPPAKDAFEKQSGVFGTRYPDLAKTYVQPSVGDPGVLIQYEQAPRQRLIIAGKEGLKRQEGVHDAVPTKNIKAIYLDNNQVTGTLRDELIKQAEANNIPVYHIDMPYKDTSPGKEFKIGTTAEPVKSVRLNATQYTPEELEARKHAAEALDIENKQRADNFTSKFNQERYQALTQNLRATNGGHIPSFEELRDSYAHNLRHEVGETSLKDLAENIASGTHRTIDPSPAPDPQDARSEAAAHFKDPKTDGKYLYHGSDDFLTSVPAGANLSHDPKIALAHGKNVYAVPRDAIEKTGKEIESGKHYAARQDHRAANVTAALRNPDTPIASPNVETENPRQNSEERNQQLIQEQRLANTKNYTPEELKALVDSYDPSKINERHEALTKIIQDKFNENFAFGKDKDILREAIENYLTHKWGPDLDNEAVNELKHDLNRGSFQTNTSMAKHRVFANSFEGELLGRKLRVTDPIALAAHNEAEFGLVAANRDALTRIRAKGFRASDGAPMVGLSGRGTFTPGDDDHGPALLLDSHNMQNILLSPQEIDRLTKTGDLDRFQEMGRLVDLTRKYTMRNIDAHIARLEDKATRANTTPIDQEGNVPIREQIRRLKGVKDGSLPLSTLDEMNEAEPKRYAWDPHDYEQIDHPAMRGWKMAAETPDGVAGMIKGDLRAHPEAAAYLRRQLGVDRSVIGENKIGKAVLGAGSEAKSFLLALSPFHIAQEGLRAVMTGISPFGIARWDPDDLKLQMGIRAGLTLGKDYSKVEDFQSQEGVGGHSKILAKLGPLGRLNDTIHDFLFDKYIPNLKARAYSALYNRYEAAYPEWTSEKVAQEAAADTNSRFGGINTKEMGRSAAMMDVSRLAALAPDWLESELRFYGRAFSPNGKIARQDLIRMMAYTWAASRVLNYVISGKPHNEAPFGVATTGEDGKEHVVSVRTLPGDLIHAASDPINFLKGRSAPLLKAGVQAYTGTDEYGRKLPEHAMFANLLAGTLQSSAPIGIQSFVQRHTGVVPETSNLEQMEKAAGLTVLPYRTQASLMVSKLASNRAPNGPVDQALVGRHQAIMAFEQEIRNGRRPITDLHNMVDDGTIDQKDAKTISKNLQETQGMDPETADFYSKAARLDPSSLLQVFDAATDNEKRVMAPLMDRARKSIFNKAMKEMTPKERMSNPTYQRFRRMYPQFAPYE